jgi:hypothetical protein
MVQLKLEHVFDLRLSFGDEMLLGATSLGHRRVFLAVTGGSVSGPRLQGEIIAGSGSDAPCFADDRVVLGGQWLIRAGDGTLILMQNGGFAIPAPDGPWRADTAEHGAVRMHLAPIFEAPRGPHEWLNRTVFVGKADRRRTDSSIRIFAVM